MSPSINIFNSITYKFPWISNYNISTYREITFHNSNWKNPVPTLLSWPPVASNFPSDEKSQHSTLCALAMIAFNSFKENPNVKLTVRIFYIEMQNLGKADNRSTAIINPLPASCWWATPSPGSTSSGDKNESTLSPKDPSIIRRSISACNSFSFPALIMPHKTLLKPIGRIRLLYMSGRINGRTTKKIIRSP